MTPATNALDAAGLEYRVVEYEHDPSHRSFALEAAEVLGLDPAQVFKTLVCKSDQGELLVGIVPADQHLDLKAIAAAAKVKKAEMAPVAEAERSSGYVAGGISPVGQKRPLRTFLHEDAILHDEINVSGGRRGLELVLTADTLIAATNATLAAIARTPSL